jgi:hypothetical protein
VQVLLGLPLAYLLHRAIRHLGRGRPRLATYAAGVAVLCLGGFADSTRVPAVPDGPPLAPRGDYTAQLYVVEDAGGPSGDHHLGLDGLIACMGAGGLKFYRSAVSGPESGPDGVVGTRDVVLIKINSQWNQRGGTNTDLLRGLIARVLEHPDGFLGEVVVVENTQGYGTLDWPRSNAEDTTQSAIDVVSHFAGLGHPVGSYLWDEIRVTRVYEYSEGDMQDGYVVGPRLTMPPLKVSYPKFETPGGKYVSLKHGIWNPVLEEYDDSNLTFLNVPVLKCHGAVYGVTAAVKNHMGTMTTGLMTNAHAAVRHGGQGTFLSQVRMADLNILDCIYILAHPSGGPWCPYGDATRVDKLVAGWDPVALDIWATTNILVPTIVANGHPSYPMQDPADSTSEFREYLDASMDEMLTAGITVTNQLDQIQANTCDLVSIDPVPAVPDAPAPLGVFPNPSGEGTAIRFLSRSGGEGRLDVYDAAGRLLRSIPARLWADEENEALWNGRDSSGRRVPPGTYFFRVTGTGNPISGKVTILR